MRNIADLINRFHRADHSHHQPAQKNIDDKTIFCVASRVIASLYGGKGGEKISPRFFKEGKLFFSAESSLWANEIWMERETIQEKINQELGQKVVREIAVSEGK